ncbi:MAG: hypothetical protein HRF44_08800 [Ignavibacterium sp.]
MTRPFDNICPRCGSPMTYVRRRGSSAGTWFCPVCRDYHGSRHDHQDRPEEPRDDSPRGMGRAA